MIPPGRDEGPRTPEAILAELVADAELFATSADRFPDAWHHGVAALLRKMAAALSPPPAPQAWQPIETAPKDGTRLLLFGPFLGGAALAVSGRWLSWTVNGDMDGGWMADGVSPTHWMPLPPAPSLATPQDGGQER